MYFDDHAPRHFHVITTDKRENLVSIDSAEIIEGNVPEREIQEAMDWAKTNKALLLARWKEFN